MVGGCAGKPGVQDTQIIAATTTSGAAETSPPGNEIRLEPLLEANTGLHLTNCTILLTGAQYPGAVFPGRVPPAWPAIGPGAVSEVVLEYSHCERINWGPFERGPIDFMTEDFDGFMVPDACKTNSTATKFMILESLWIGDSEIVAWAKARFPLLPIVQGHFNLTSTPLAGPLVRWRIDISHEAGPVAEIDWTSGALSHRLSFSERLLVANDTRVMAMDWHEEYVTDEGQPVPAQTGTVAPPLLYGQSGLPYSGIGELDGQASSDYNFRELGDVTCTGHGSGTD